MVKFAHLADCHLGGWRQEELTRLNFKTFKTIIDRCIHEQVDFILIAGDLFDSAYPPIEILKESFALFKKIHDANIPVYLIAGSHDFSASGKTFLDVLEKSGFCTNVENYDIGEDGSINLKPTFHKEIAIYGYPGKKSGMEVDDLRRVRFDSFAPFTIFMIHTTLKDVVGTLPIDSVEKEKLPLADYYAIGHIHQRFKAQHSQSHYSYPGPTFPMNFQELIDLQHGSFNIVTVSNGKISIENKEVSLKDVVYLEVEITNGLEATEEIISRIDKLSLRDKIFLLKLKGILTQGKLGDVRFNEIEEFVKKKEVYSFLRNISSVSVYEGDVRPFYSGERNVEDIESAVFKDYSSKNPAEFNAYLPELMNAFSLEKNEDEKSTIFEERLLSDVRHILKVSEMI